MIKHKKPQIKIVHRKMHPITRLTLIFMISISLSVMFLQPTMSKYTDNHLGIDSARIATAVTTLVEDPSTNLFQRTINLGDVVTYQFSVSNQTSGGAIQSDTDMDYKIIIETDDPNTSSFVLYHASPVNPSMSFGSAITMDSSEDFVFYDSQMKLESEYADTQYFILQYTPTSLGYNDFRVKILSVQADT